MPLFDFYCAHCKSDFEALVSSASERAECPQCKKADQVEKKPPLFKVAGRGDQRTHTMHGCHDCHVGHNHAPSQKKRSAKVK